MPLILGANALTAGGFAIDNSLRFNSGSSDRLTRTLSSGTSNTIGTISVWVKRANLSATKSILGVNTNGDNFFIIQFGNSSDQLNIRLYDDGSPDANYNTTAVFRDVSAWYHVVVAFDTTQATSSNRIKAYVNNTLHSLSGYPPQNQTLYTGTSGATMAVGDSSFDNSHYDGYMSEYNFIDGQQLAPSDFGETDEDSGIWKPIAYEGTYGTNGFFLEFLDSSALGDDTSGNGNDFTVNNLTSVDQSIDTPTNNFCTLNPLMKSTTDVVLTQGNLNMVSNFAGGWQHSGSTFAVKTGKWYWEAKATVVSATDKTSIGVVQFDTTQVNFQGNTNLDLATYGISGHGAGTGGYTYAQGDIILCAMDLDNNKVYWGKNGTYFGTLDPAAGTGATTQTIDNNNFCMPIVGGYGGSTWELNFGFPQFTVSSGNADANGYGNFEYAVPSGFYALNTKNLAEYG